MVSFRLVSRLGIPQGFEVTPKEIIESAMKAGGMLKLMPDGNMAVLVADEWYQAHKLELRRKWDSVVLELKKQREEATV